jgi:hypothetical protein
MSYRRLREDSRARPLAAALLPALAVVTASALALAGQTPVSGRLTVVERVLAQDQGDWQIDYSLKNDRSNALVLAPAEIAARVEGWLSNSRVAVHANPRRSETLIDGKAGPMATAEVIPSPDDSLRCRERALIRVWADSAKVATPARGADPEPLATVTVEPGALLRVRIRLEHQHCLYGDYDPLLGRRDLELRLGAETIRDVLPLDREQYLAQPKETWPEPAEEHKDNRHFMSAPDSLLLEAGVPGNQYFRFPERKVRYSSRVRLRFWYRVAPGTEGEVKARIAQYRESPNAWKVLSDGGSEQTLKTVGRWVKFEKTFKTESEATTLALDFRIANAEVGEVWIDDVTLEPIDAATGGP